MQSNTFALKPLNQRDGKGDCTLLRGCNSERVQLEHQRYFQSLLQAPFSLSFLIFFFSSHVTRHYLLRKMDASMPICIFRNGLVHSVPPTAF